MAERASFGRTRVRGEPDVQQIPEIRFSEGSARAAEDFADSMFRLSSQMQDRLDEQTRREASIKGAIAGQKPGFEPMEGDTIAANAFNRAGKQSFLNQLEIRARRKVDELYEQNSASPDDLEAAYRGYREGMVKELQQAAPELVQDFDATFQRHTMPRIRQAGQNYREIQAAEYEVEALETVDQIFRTSERLARIQDIDEEAAENLAGERTHLIQMLAAQGPEGAFEFKGVEMEADPTRTGTFSIKDMQRIVERFDQRVRTARVMGKFQRADDKRAFLNSWVEDQRDNTQSPFSLNEVEKLASNMRSVIRSNEAEVRARRNQLEDRVDDATYILEHGGEPANLEQLRRATSQFPELQGRLQAAETDRERTAEFGKMAPAQQQQILNSLAQEPPQTRRGVELRERLNRVHNDTVTGLKQDPVSLAARRGLVNAQPLDFDDPSTFQQRKAAAKKIEAHYGVQTHGFTQDEVDMIQGRLSQLDTEGKISLMGTIHNNLGGPDTRQLMSDLAPDNPEFAVAASIAGEDFQLAKNIVRGKDIIDNAESSQAMPSPSDYISAANDVLGDSMFWNPDAYDATIKAALALDARRRMQRGEFTRQDFDVSDFKDSLRKVTGGVFEWNGQKVVAPMRGMDEGRFETVMENLSNEDLAVGGVMPKAGDKPVTADRLRRYGTLETVGDGLYLVKVGNGYAQGPDGDPYELDLKRIIRNGSTSAGTGERRQQSSARGSAGAGGGGEPVELGTPQRVESVSGMSDLRPLQDDEAVTMPDGGTSGRDMATAVQLDDNTFITVPTVWQSEDGPVMLSEDQAGRVARQWERQRGETFPRYDSLEAAEAATADTMDLLNQPARGEGTEAETQRDERRVDDLLQGVD
jgi:hypothetical protein